MQEPTLIILLAAVGQMVSCGVRVNAPDPPVAPELEPKVADNRLRGFGRHQENVDSYDYAEYADDGSEEQYKPNRKNSKPGLRRHQEMYDDSYDSDYADDDSQEQYKAPWKNSKPGSRRHQDTFDDSYDSDYVYDDSQEQYKAPLTNNKPGFRRHQDLVDDSYDSDYADEDSQEQYRAPWKNNKPGFRTHQDLVDDSYDSDYADDDSQEQYRAPWKNNAPARNDFDDFEDDDDYNDYNNDNDQGINKRRYGPSENKDYYAAGDGADYDNLNDYNGEMNVHQKYRMYQEIPAKNNYFGSESSYDDYEDMNKRHYAAPAKQDNYEPEDTDDYYYREDKNSPIHYGQPEVDDGIADNGDYYKWGTHHYKKIHGRFNRLTDAENLKTNVEAAKKPAIRKPNKDEEKKKAGEQ